MAKKLMKAQMGAFITKAVKAGVKATKPAVKATNKATKYTAKEAAKDVNASVKRGETTIPVSTLKRDRAAEALKKRNAAYDQSVWDSYKKKGGATKSKKK